MKNLYYIVFLFALVSSCKKPLSNIDGYSLDKNGFYYQLLSIGDEKKQPANTQYVLVKAEMFTLSDSIFWDTTHDTENGLFHHTLLELYRGTGLLNSITAWV